MDAGVAMVEALRPVWDEFRRLGVRYDIGGSWASSSHGAARSTLDVDLAAELDESRANHLMAALRGDYYVGEQAVLEAVRLTQVVRLQGERMDREYLRHRANVLGVADLLERLQKEAAAEGD